MIGASLRSAFGWNFPPNVSGLLAQLGASALWARKWKPVSGWTALPMAIQILYAPARFLMDLIPPNRCTETHFVWWFEDE